MTSVIIHSSFDIIDRMEAEVNRLKTLVILFSSRKLIKIQKKDSKNEHSNKYLSLLVLTEL